VELKPLLDRPYVASHNYNYAANSNGMLCTKGTCLFITHRHNAHHCCRIVNIGSWVLASVCAVSSAAALWRVRKIMFEGERLLLDAFRSAERLRSSYTSSSNLAVPIECKFAVADVAEHLPLQIWHAHYFP